MTIRLTLNQQHSDNFQTFTPHRAIVRRMTEKIGFIEPDETSKQFILLDRDVYHHYLAGLNLILNLVSDHPAISVADVDKRLKLLLSGPFPEPLRQNLESNYAAAKTLREGLSSGDQTAQDFLVALSQFYFVMRWAEKNW